MESAGLGEMAFVRKYVTILRFHDLTNHTVIRLRGCRIYRGFAADGEAVNSAQLAIGILGSVVTCFPALRQLDPEVEHRDPVPGQCSELSPSPTTTRAPLLRNPAD